MTHKSLKSQNNASFGKINKNDLGKLLIALLILCITLITIGALLMAGDANANNEPGKLIPGSENSIATASNSIAQKSYSISKLPEQPSPKARISQDQIKVYGDKVVIELKDAEWASFADTNSMDPVLDAGDYAIQIIPKTSSEIQTGDIISYKSNLVDATIIHRVVEVGQDKDGWYAITKGDNSNNKDPEKVRFSQVKRVVVAVIY